MAQKIGRDIVMSHTHWAHDSPLQVAGPRSERSSSPVRAQVQVYSCVANAVCYLFVTLIFAQPSCARVFAEHVSMWWHVVTRLIYFALPLKAIPRHRWGKTSRRAKEATQVKTKRYGPFSSLRQADSAKSTETCSRTCGKCVSRKC